MFTAAATLAAQPLPPPTVSAPPAAPDFLTRYDFHLAAAALASGDDQVAANGGHFSRFSWDTHFGGALDVVDYVGGRAGINVDYEAVLGNEYRPFDPNQGNYTLEASASGRLGSTTEVVGVFHHVSRHLSDRPKPFAIAWNVLGARVLQQVALKDSTLDIDLEGGKIVQHSYVDYDWVGELHLQLRHPINDRLTAFGRATGQLIGVTGEVRDREQQISLAMEVGFRVRGGSGALELFAGFERRADADPIDRQPQNWALAGFRLLSR
jgi:hypothetical protein